MNNRKVGANYEDLAASYLENNGYEILHRNFRNRQGEIDIIAKDNSTVVFVEVKFRTSNELGYPEEAVSLAKQRTIIRVAKYYMLINGITNIDSRFDVIACYKNNEIKHIKNAFGGF